MREVHQPLGAFRQHVATAGPEVIAGKDDAERYRLQEIAKVQREVEAHPPDMDKAKAWLRP